MLLRPDAWTDFTLSADPAVRRAMLLVRKLDKIANRSGGPPTIGMMPWTPLRPRMIPKQLETLHLARPPMTPGRSDRSICDENGPLLRRGRSVRARQDSRSGPSC